MNAVARALKRVHGCAVRHLDHAHAVDVRDDVVYAQAAVVGRRAPVDDLGDEDGVVVGQVRVVSPACKTD